MYVPAAFRADPETVRRLLDAMGAADLVTATPSGPVSTYLPLLFDPALGEHGSLLGHVARANDHWRRDVIGEALAIVRGPDAYISPAWYPTKAEHGRVVPTWNYLTVHVYGRLVVHDDPAWVGSLVRRLTAKHESGRPAPWTVDDAPEEFVAAQLGAIVGIELSISRTEGKSKWSQNRTDADRHGVARGLEAEGRGAAAAMARASGRQSRSAAGPPRS